MHRDDFKALTVFNAESARELPEYEEFDELRTQIQDNDDLWIVDQDDLEEFFNYGLADTIADGIISSFAKDDKEKDVLGWSVKETMDAIRINNLAEYRLFDETTTLEQIQRFIDKINDDIYESSISIVQMVMYLPEQIKHMEKFPVRRILPFEWKPK